MESQKPANENDSADDGPFASWTKATTWHGMPDLFGSNNRLAKCVWIFVMLFTAYMFMLQVTQLMVDFVTGSKWGTSSFGESPSGGLVFPDVTVCNINLVSQKRMSELNISTKLVQYMMEGLSPFTHELKWVPDNETRDHYEKVMRQEYLDWVGNDTYVDLKKWLRLLSPSCKETIKHCSLGKGNRRQWFDCCSNAVDIFFVDYGLCFILHVPENVSSIVVQDQAGTVNGMTLHLDPDLENYAKLEVQTDQGAGIILGLGYDPEYSIVSSPVVLRPGSHSWLAMTATEDRTTYYGDGRHIFFDILETINPLSIFNADLPCNPNGKLDVLSGPYLFETCIEDCVVQQIVKMCGCAPLHPVQEQYVTCDPPTSQGCVSDFWQNQTYGSRHWTGSMPTEENVKNRVIVEIYFESTQIYVSEMSEHRTVVGLVSNIGGNLGVWAGISIVTLFQALVMLTNVSRLTISHRINGMRNVGHKLARCQHAA